MYSCEKPGYREVDASTKVGFYKHIFKHFTIFATIDESCVFQYSSFVTSKNIIGSKTYHKTNH